MRAPSFTERQYGLRPADAINGAKCAPAGAGPGLIVIEFWCQVHGIILSSLQALLLGLLLVSGSAAAAASLTLQPYTLLAPKKIVLNHLHSHGPGASPAGSFAAAATAANVTGVPAAEDAVTRSVWSITSFDSGPVERALPAGMDWQPVPTQPRELQVRRQSIPVAYRMLNWSV